MPAQSTSHTMTGTNRHTTMTKKQFLDELNWKEDLILNIIRVGCFTRIYIDVSKPYLLTTTWEKKVYNFRRTEHRNFYLPRHCSNYYTIYFKSYGWWHRWSDSKHCKVAAYRGVQRSVARLGWDCALTLTAPLASTNHLLIMDCAWVKLKSPPTSLIRSTTFCSSCCRLSRQ